MSWVKEFDGVVYEVLMASDLVHDGMSLELWHGRKQVMSCFYSDVDGRLSLTAHRAALPLELVEWFIAEARRELPPETPPS